MTIQKTIEIQSLKLGISILLLTKKILNVSFVQKSINALNDLAGVPRTKTE